MIPRLLRPATAVAVAVATLPAQDSIYYPDNRTDLGSCNAIPFGSFTKYPFAQSHKYQTLIPWATLSALSRFVVEDIGFVPCYDGVQHFSSIKIRMGQMSGTSMSKDFAANLGKAPVTVLDSKDYYWHHTKGAWSRIGLQKPFKLTTGLSLVVDIEVTGAYFLAKNFGPSQTATGSFRSASLPRLIALSWKGQPPAKGRLKAGGGLKIEIASRVADLATFGIGCKGSGTKRPTLSLSGSARPAGTVNVALSDALPLNSTLLVIGFDNKAPYPLALGFPECSLYHSVSLPLAAMTTANGKLTIPIPIPSSPVLQNQRFYTQYFQIEVNKNGLGLRASNYGRALIR